MPVLNAAGHSLALRMDRGRRRQAGAGVPARRARLDPAVARFSGEALLRRPAAARWSTTAMATGSRTCSRSRGRTVRFMHDEALDCLTRAPGRVEDRESDPRRSLGRRVDRADPRRRRPRGARRGGDGAARVHRADVPDVDRQGEGGFETTDLAEQARPLPPGRAQDVLRLGRRLARSASSRAGTSATTICRACAARCSRSRATTTSTAPWRSSTRSSGA